MPGTRGEGKVNAYISEDKTVFVEKEKNETKKHATRLLITSQVGRLGSLQIQETWEYNYKSLSRGRCTFASNGFHSKWRWSHTCACTHVKEKQDWPGWMKEINKTSDSAWGEQMIWQEIKWCFGNLFTEVICALCAHKRNRLPVGLMFSCEGSSQCALVYIK